MNNKPTVVLDFDGVIHSYRSGWKGPTVAVDPPVPGIREAIKNIRKTHRVVIVSARCSQMGGRPTIKEYLRRNGIYVDAIMAEKPPAVVYVDDRAITFDGNADTLHEKILNFKPWNAPIDGTVKDNG